MDISTNSFQDVSEPHKHEYNLIQIKKMNANMKITKNK